MSIKKIYMALTALILITSLWLLGTTYLLGLSEVLSGNFRGALSLILIYLIIVLTNAIRLYKKGGIELVQNFFKERKNFQEKYYGKDWNGDDKDD